MNINQIVERSAGLVRQNTRQAERLSRRVVSDTYGLVQRARHLRAEHSRRGEGRAQAPLGSLEPVPPGSEP